MTLRDKALNEARPVVRCKMNTSCWCNRITTRLPIDSNVCMSPEEMLFEYGELICHEDKAYLESLLRYKFEHK